MNRMPSDSHQSYLLNKRKTVFELLEKNPLLTPNALILMLGIPKNERKKEYGYLKKLRYDWKSYHPKERGSIRSCPDEVHNSFFRGRLPLGVVGSLRGQLSEIFGRSGAVWCLGYPNPRLTGCGWTFTKATNHFIYYKSGLGWIKVFNTGTVVLFVRKPANEGKCMQLFCTALIKTGLFDSVRMVEDFQNTLMRKMHVIFDAGQRLPYMKITAFQDTHKFVAVSGDRSHPTCWEFMMEYNAEVAAARVFMDKLGEFFDLVNGKGSVGNGGVKPLERDYSS